MLALSIFIDEVNGKRHVREIFWRFPSILSDRNEVARAKIQLFDIFLVVIVSLTHIFGNWVSLDNHSLKVRMAKH